MPFIVSRPQPHGKLYRERGPDGEMRWQPNRDKADRMTEDAAEAEAADLRKYTTAEIDVEGAKEIKAAA